MSKDPLILEALLKLANLQFEEMTEITLDLDIKLFNDLDHTVRRLAIQENDPKQERRKLLKELDSHEKIKNEKDFDGKAPLDQITTALKTMQILGQFLKNFSLSDRCACRFCEL